VIVNSVGLCLLHSLKLVVVRDARVIFRLEFLGVLDDILNRFEEGGNESTVTLAVVHSVGDRHHLADHDFIVDDDRLLVNRAAADNYRWVKRAWDRG